MVNVVEVRGTIQNITGTLLDLFENPDAVHRRKVVVGWWTNAKRQNVIMYIL